MDPIFEAYVSCLVEKDVSDSKYSIYITCKLSKDLWTAWSALAHNLSEADEVEDDPHCTFLWAEFEEEQDAQELYDIVSPLLEDIQFEIMPIGFNIFEGVNDGTQNCLVVKLNAPGDIIQLQQEVQHKIEARGIKLLQNFDGWSPHMTIAYFPAEEEIHYDQPSNSMLENTINAKVDYMKINNGEAMNFE